MYSTSLPRPAVFCVFRKNFFKHDFIQEYSRIFEKNRVDFEDLGEFYRKNLVKK